jgi:hypothetical protein
MDAGLWWAVACGSQKACKAKGTTICAVQQAIIGEKCLGHLNFFAVEPGNDEYFDYICIYENQLLTQST